MIPINNNQWYNKYLYNNGFNHDFRWYVGIIVTDYSIGCDYMTLVVFLIFDR